MKITKTKSGKYTTHVAIGIGTDGKRKYKRFTYPTKEMVRQKANEFLATHKQTVDIYSLESTIQKYIDERKAVLSPSTIKGYTSLLRVLKDKFPTLAKMNISLITTSDVQNLVSELASTEHARKYISNMLGLLHSSMKTRGYALPSVSLPESKKEVYEVPSKEHVNALLKAAKGKRIEIALRLSTYGLRRGEVCAVSASDLSRDNVLHVQRAFVETVDKEWIEKTPKTPESDRMIPIDTELATLIRQNASRKHVADYDNPRAYSAAYLRFLKSSKLEYYKLHSFRHFFASYLHEKGYSDAEIMKLGGWSTPHIMQKVYRHALTLPNPSNLIGDLASE